MAIRKASTNKVVSGVRGNLAVKSTKLDGNLAQNDNIFTVTGTVEIGEIYGVVTSLVNATTCSLASFTLYDGGVTADITDSTGPTDLSGLRVGSVMGKFNSVASGIGLINSNQARVTEGGSDMLHYKFGAIQKNATTTYIRFNFTGDVNTDIDVTFYVRYRPLSENGAVTPV